MRWLPLCLALLAALPAHAHEPLPLPLLPYRDPEARLPVPPPTPWNLAQMYVVRHAIPYATGTSTPTNTPTNTPTASATVTSGGSSYFTDTFTNGAALQSGWTQFTVENGGSNGGSIVIEDVADAARADGSNDSIAYYGSFTPNQSGYACVNTGNSLSGSYAGACLGVSSSTAVCCYLGATNKWGMAKWVSGNAFTDVVAETTNASIAVGDFIGIQRTSATAFQCYLADAASPTTWTALGGGTSSVADMADPGRGGVYGYTTGPQMPQFEVGNGSLPTSRTCGVP